jgi:glycosyltransferase involved in cell wall biosynthesis
LKIVDARRNFGQTWALMVEINFASGRVVVSIDADLQNPSREYLGCLRNWSKGMASSPAGAKI